jgi:hypothetical protein
MLLLGVVSVLGGGTGGGVMAVSWGAKGVSLLRDCI